MGCFTVWKAGEDAALISLQSAYTIRTGEPHPAFFCTFELLQAGCRTMQQTVLAAACAIPGGSKT